MKWQGDKRWGKEILGDGNSSFANAGCLLFCILEAAHHYGTIGDDFSPQDLNEALYEAGAFIGSNIIIPKAVVAVDLHASERTTARPDTEENTEILRDAIRIGLAAGLCILHVATDATLHGRHFILATGMINDKILCYCPALAHMIEIPLDTLRVKLMWGQKPKHYAVVSVAPITCP